MKISVITASYNYAKYIEETIQSVINQTYTDWELIVVDDGSTDNSVEIIRKYCNQDNRIKLYTHPNNENKGLKETLLLGISKASSDWIAFLESDDTWREDYLEKKFEIASKYSDIGIIFNDVNFLGDDTLVRKHEINKKNMDSLYQMEFPCDLFKKLNVFNYILTFSCVMVRKNLLKLEYFNTPVDKLLDWWLYIHLSYTNDAFFIKEKLTNWRIHNDSYILSKRSKKMIFVHLNAYIDIWNQHKDDLGLLIFILYSFLLNVIMYFWKLKIKVVRYIKREFARSKN